MSIVIIIFQSSNLFSIYFFFLRIFYLFNVNNKIYALLHSIYQYQHSPINIYKTLLTPTTHATHIPYNTQEKQIEKKLHT